MKANRKFREGQEAVSAVIGVILMVAITVAIAATVYVYVSGMIGGQKQSAPTVQFTVDESQDRLTVVSTGPNLPWTGFEIRPNQAISFKVNGVPTSTGSLVGANVLHQIAAADITGGAAPYYIQASDFLAFTGQLVAGGVTNNLQVTIVHMDTGTTIGSYNIITVAAPLS